MHDKFIKRKEHAIVPMSRIKVTPPYAQKSSYQNSEQLLKSFVKGKIGANNIEVPKIARTKRGVMHHTNFMI